MPVVKRYPNRKLYDTEAKQYITLDDVAKLIRRGEDVQVLDHATGEDLTALTLSQVIFEQEKKNSGFIPYSVLTGLIRAGGETLGTLRRTLASSLGLVRHVDQEIERRVLELVWQGELTQQEGRELVDQLLALGHGAPDSVVPDENALAHVMGKRGVPTRDELMALMEQLESLEAKLDQIGHKPQRR
jgi:polyhydroxyalkanoate synthesis repressor PhaR